MDFIYLSVMLVTMLIVIAYVYFYYLYRERYIGLWLAGWSIFFARIVIFDYGYGSFNWKQSAIAITCFQIIILINSLTFVWGTYVLIDKPVKKSWLYIGSGLFILGALATLLNLPILYKLLPSLGFASFTCMWIGRIFTHHLNTSGIGNYVTGYALYLWGLLTLFMPYYISIPWLSPLCYLASGIDRLIIVLGVLVVYLENTISGLSKKEAQYRFLAENAVDVIFHYNLLPVAKFEYISPAVLSVTGYSPEDYYEDAKLLVKLIHPDDLPLFNEFMKNPLSDFSITFRLLRKDQTVIWVEQKCVALFDNNGHLTAFEGIIRDATARINVEQLVSRADQMNLVGQMAASVAHEIRNPLTSVRGYLQIMQLKEECTSKKERYNLMIKELDRSNMIISEYLLLAKNKVPDLTRCSLNNIISASLPLIEAAAIVSCTHIKLALEAIPDLFLDENEIRQLLFNLVNNALDAMPAGGELTIRTFLEDNKVVLAISDQGSGIPSHVLDNLGTPFLTTKDSGTGLGLPVCYRIANRHNATIRVKTSNQGTTFFIKFN